MCLTPSKHNTPQAIYDTPPESGESPDGRPLGVFIGGFDPGMEAGFILITNWYIELYGVFKPGHEGRGRKAKRTRMRPRFMGRDGLFVRHTTDKALAMPKSGLVAQKAGTIETLVVLRSIIFRV